MKITSKALFFEDADRSNGMVVFTGTGSVHGTDTDIQKIIDLPESSLCFKSADSDGNVVVIVRTPAGDFPLTLSDVENQETWVNTQAGADAALAMIDSWKKKSSVVPSPGDEGDVLTVESGAWVSKPQPAGAGVVVQDLNLIADVQEITLPTGVSGNFLHQIFQVSGTQLIPQPNVQMYYNSADSKWRIDLTGAEAMTAKIYYLL